MAPIVRLASPSELPSLLAIRHEVFVQEQGVPPDVEVDGLDPACTHLVALLDGVPVGTARLRETADGRAKAERVAVLGRYRGRGIGVALMDALEDEALRRGHRRVVLAAQREAIPFYERIGYRGEGAFFVEAGIDHRWMAKPLGG